MARAIIDTLFGKSLFERLLINKSGNREKIYFDKTTTRSDETIGKTFDIDPTIFYKPFEIEIIYDITGKTQKQTFAFFCCRYVGGEPSVHVFAMNKVLNFDISSIGSSDRINTGITLKDKGKINIQYNGGNIMLFYNNELRNNFYLIKNKLINGLPNKCAVGQSYSVRGGEMANSINGTVNVKIKELKE